MIEASYNNDGQAISPQGEKPSVFYRFADLKGQIVALLIQSNKIGPLSPEGQNLTRQALDLQRESTNIL